MHEFSKGPEGEARAIDWWVIPWIRLLLAGFHLIKNGNKERKSCVAGKDEHPSNPALSPAVAGQMTLGKTQIIAASSSLWCILVLELRCSITSWVPAQCLGSYPELGLSFMILPRAGILASEVNGQQYFKCLGFSYWLDEDVSFKNIASEWIYPSNPDGWYFVVST